MEPFRYVGQTQSKKGKDPMNTEKENEQNWGWVLIKVGIICIYKLRRLIQVTQKKMKTIQ